MSKPFRQVQTSDRVLETIQSNIKASIQDLTKAPELNASYVSVDTSASVDIIVNHLLGRPFQHYSITRSDADVRVWDSATVNTNRTKQLILRASGTATITLKVY